jgi:DNA-binding transcriptional regulator LsrR (DeoR family)
MSDLVEGAGPEGTENDPHLAARIARMYFLQDMSKVDIASELAMSRFKVARLLDRARADGLVTVTVHDPGSRDHTLSDALAKALGIPRVLVADSDDPAGWLQAVGTLAASYLREVVTADSVLGIAWSRAIRSLIEQFTGLPRCTVVQLCGVLPGTHGEEHNVELVRRAAQSCGGTAVAFYAPLVLPDAATARTLRRQPGIADALERCEELSAAVIAVGQWEPGSSTVYDALPVAEAQAFARAGGLAETAGMLFDADGKALRNGLQKRVVAITERQLRRCSDVIALATEPERAPAVRALARSGLISTLITHRAVAQTLLQPATETHNARR